MNFAFYRVSAEREKLSTQIASLEEEIHALEKNRLEIVREREELSLTIEKTNAEIMNLEARISDYDFSVKSMKDKIEELEKDRAAFLKDVTEKENAFSFNQNQIIEKDEQIVQFTSESLIKTREIERLTKEVSSARDEVKMLQVEVTELRYKNDRITTEFGDMASELQSLQSAVVEYRSVIDNKELLLNSLHQQLENKDECLQEMKAELTDERERRYHEKTKMKNVDSERVASSEVISQLRSQLQSVISENELLTASWKTQEAKNRDSVSELQAEMENLSKTQKRISSDLETCESNLREEIETRSKVSEEHDRLEKEYNQLSRLNQESFNSLETTFNTLQVVQKEYDDAKEELDSVVCANAACQNENSDLQQELKRMCAAVPKLEFDRDEATKKCEDAHQHVTKISKEKEALIQELDVMRSDLNCLLTENENHVLEIQTLHEENERLINLQDNISHLESEVQILGSELQSSEKQNLQWAISEEKWNKKIKSIKQEVSFKIVLNVLMKRILFER